MASFRKHGKVWYYRFTDADGIKRERKGCSDRERPRNWPALPSRSCAGTRPDCPTPRPNGSHGKAAARSPSMSPSSSPAWNRRGTIRSTSDRPGPTSSASSTLAGIERIGDLTPSAVMQAVAALKADGLSARAVNAYLTAVKSFSRWLKRDGRTVRLHARDADQAERASRPPPHSSSPDPRGSRPSHPGRRDRPRGRWTDRP